jgi:hypothetical protein
VQKFNTVLCSLKTAYVRPWWLYTLSAHDKNWHKTQAVLNSRAGYYKHGRWQMLLKICLGEKKLKSFVLLCQLHVLDTAISLRVKSWASQWWNGRIQYNGISMWRIILVRTGSSSTSCAGIKTSLFLRMCQDHKRRAVWQWGFIVNESLTAELIWNNILV